MYVDGYKEMLNFLPIVELYWIYRLRIVILYIKYNEFKCV